MSKAILDLTNITDTSMLQDVICVKCDADSPQSADLEGQSKRVKNASSRVVISSSIDDLPEGKTLPRENMLILWKLDQGFTESFFTQPKCKSPQRKTTTPRGKQGTTSGLRVSPRKRSASEACAGGAVKKGA